MGIFDWIFKKEATEPRDEMAEYRRTVDRMIVTGWMRWEFTPPPRDLLVRVCRPGKPGERILKGCELFPEFNISDLFWRPWQGHTIDGDQAASRPVLTHSSSTASGSGFFGVQPGA